MFNLTKTFTVLSNETRWNILTWLKHPRKYFPEGVCATEAKGLKLEEIGVCVGLIQQKAGLSQSTTSNYLSQLQGIGLVEAQRLGQWTYYRRNEGNIKKLAEQLGKDL